MKSRILMLAACAVSVSAQATLTATANPSSARPGQQITVTLSLSGTTPVAALQWQLGLPAGWTTTQTATAALTGAQKQVNCGSLLCVGWGFNATPVPTGAIVTAPITVPNNIFGPTQISLTNVAGASPAGIVTLVSAVGVTVTVISPYDLDGDGQVTKSDVIAVLTAVANGNCTFDLIGGGAPCNVAQLQAEVNGWGAAGSKP